MLDLAEIQEFIDCSQKATDIDQLMALFAKKIAPLGFDKFTCITMADPDLHKQETLMLLHWPKEWLDYYMQNHYEQHDRIFQIALKRSLPFKWTDDFVQKGMTKPQLKIFNEAAEVGIINGYTIPIYGPDTLPACVNIVGQDLDVDPAVFPGLHLMGVYLHSAATRISNSYKKKHDYAPLTPRETECLKWVSLGKTNWEIGKILNISQTTVRTHIDNVKEKLGVITSTQAVAIAISEGVIAF